MSKRTRLLALLAVSLTAVRVFACVSPPPWDIDSPAESPQENFLADVGCSGDALGDGGYTVKVVIGNDILNSKGDTATNCAWGTTVPEKSGGWTTFNTYVDADLELWASEERRDVVVIGVK